MRPSDLDDICSVIGYTATRVLTAWFGGRFVAVPKNADPDHPLAVLLGFSAFRALVEAFGSQGLRIPTAGDEWRYYRDRVVAERISEGVTIEQIAAEVNLTVRRVQLLRTDLIERGWIAYASGDAPKFSRWYKRALIRGDLPPPELITSAL